MSSIFEPISDGLERKEGRKSSADENEGSLSLSSGRDMLDFLTHHIKITLNNILGILGGSPPPAPFSEDEQLVLWSVVSQKLLSAGYMEKQIPFDEFLLRWRAGVQYDIENYACYKSTARRFPDGYEVFEAQCPFHLWEKSQDASLKRDFVNPSPNYPDRLKNKEKGGIEDTPFSYKVTILE